MNRLLKHSHMGLIFDEWVDTHTCTCLLMNGLKSTSTPEAGYATSPVLQSLARLLRLVHDMPRARSRFIEAMSQGQR